MKRPDFRVVIIEASAGTGKTSRITREFIDYLKASENPAVMMRKILAITFSEKSAVEMKMRILEKIYLEIYPALSEYGKVEVENAMFKLRISTIHSFCRILLKRFAFYTGMDPFFTVIDEKESDLLYYRAFLNFLNSRNFKKILPMLKDFKLNSLKNLLFALRGCYPYATAGLPEGPFSKEIYNLFRCISEVHSRIKRELSVLDFNDLEVLTYKMLTDFPESLTILEDFDEKNNYIFVDEFQDTNILQWDIIYKLVEEWLSGYGAKAETGESYGLYLVGDRKQSIYKFRGAEGGVFDESRSVLGNYYSEEKLLKNYRSEPLILKFVNNAFGDTHPWDEQPLFPGIERRSPSRIEINFVDENKNPEAKNKEYEWVIGRIFELVNQKELVWDKGTGVMRPIEFRDIAILMREKTGDKFLFLEQHLKKTSLPFIVLGGIGFYNEPEIIFLLSLIFAIADPTDNLSLWNLRNSVYRITGEQIYKWRGRLSSEELTMAVESILEEIDYWNGLSTQQRANTEKFLLLLQGWEDLPLYQVSRNLRTVALSSKEPKADIFSEHQNAVRILTVHSAKGLEFPAVFLINAEDGSVTLKDEIIYRRTPGEKVPYRFLLRSEADEEYKEYYKNVLAEEEERVLYVALTRARQYLFISGVKNKRGSNNMLWLNRLKKFETVFPPTSVGPFTERMHSILDLKEKDKGTIQIEKKFSVLTSYTGEKEQEYYILEKTVTGDIAHKLMCDISEGRIRLEKQQYEDRVRFYLGKTGLSDVQEIEKVLMSVYANLYKKKHLRAIVENLLEGEGFSELPFIVEVEQDKVYTGAIDRVILNRKKGLCCIYDYKVEGGEPGCYVQQMEIYEKAVRKIFPDITLVKRFIVFLRKGTLQEI